jgi:hypothetical protein
LNIKKMTTGSPACAGLLQPELSVFKRENVMSGGKPNRNWTVIMYGLLAFGVVVGIVSVVGYHL